MFTLKIFTPEKYKCEYRATQSVDSVSFASWECSSRKSIEYSFPLFNMMLKKMFWNSSSFECSNQNGGWDG